MEIDFLQNIDHYISFERQFDTDYFLLQIFMKTY